MVAVSSRVQTHLRLSPRLSNSVGPGRKRGCIMADRRMLSKSLSTSRKWARLHDVLPDLAEFAKSLFPLLVVHADDYGRGPGDAFTVKLQIEPTSPRTVGDFERALDGLTTVELITRYVAGTVSVYQIINFAAHQTQRYYARPLFPDASGNYPEIPAHPRNSRKNDDLRAKNAGFAGDEKRREEMYVRTRENEVQAVQLAS